MAGIKRRHYFPTHGVSQQASDSCSKTNFKGSQVKKLTNQAKALTKHPKFSPHAGREYAHFPRHVITPMKNIVIMSRRTKYRKKVPWDNGRDASHHDEMAGRYEATGARGKLAKNCRGSSPL